MARTLAEMGAIADLTENLAAAVGHDTAVAIVMVIIGLLLGLSAR